MQGDKFLKSRNNLAVLKMKNRDYDEMPELDTSDDGHLTISTEVLGRALIERDDELPSRRSIASQLIGELEAYGIPPGEVSEEQGRRIIRWY